MYLAGSAKWGKLPVVGAIPSPRYHHRMCVANGKIYLFGGTSQIDKNDDLETPVYERESVEEGMNRIFLIRNERPELFCQY
jgi:hypothetical protein